MTIFAKCAAILGVIDGPYVCLSVYVCVCVTLCMCVCVYEYGVNTVTETSVYIKNDFPSSIIISPY